MVHISKSANLGRLEARPPEVLLASKGRFAELSPAMESNEQCFPKCSVLGVRHVWQVVDTVLLSPDMVRDGCECGGHHWCLGLSRPFCELTI